jgi:hypothetical protein
VSYPAKPVHVRVADLFADEKAITRRVRLELSSGDRLDCTAPFFDSDRLTLHVTLKDGSVREIQPSDIRTLDERRARWPARVGLGISILVAGIVTGLLAVSSTGDLTGQDGAFLGGLAGAFAGTLCVWLVQDLRPFSSWRRVFPSADA